MDARGVMVTPDDCTEEDDELQCECRHTFTREQLDMTFRIEITYETLEANGGSIRIDCDSDGDVDSAALREYCIERAECNMCSCCTIENGRISAAPIEQWMCGNCLKIWTDEEDAEGCCQDDD